MTFIEMIKVALDYWGCPLCGNHHKTIFHSYPWRFTIDKDGNKHRIRVATIICNCSREKKQQYTKRILPEYLIWRSPLWREGLIRLLEEGQEIAQGFIEKACEVLGCIDARTVRKHTVRTQTEVQVKLVLVSHLLAFTQTDEPNITPDIKVFPRLTLLWHKFLQTIRERLGFLVAKELTPFLWLGTGLNIFVDFNRSCTVLKGIP